MKTPPTPWKVREDGLGWEEGPIKVVGRPQPRFRETAGQWDDLPPGAKVLGRRKPARGNLVSAAGLFEMAKVMRAGKKFVPRGLYRFKTPEESDAWMLKMTARP